MTNRYSFGSISSGTMLDEDLIPAFAAELDRLSQDDEHKKLVAKAEAIEDFDTEEAWSIYEELFDALDSLAAPYFYFGAHPGDGADYGFWLSESFNEDFDGLKVDDLSEVPDDYLGEVAVINDHGNVSLYYRDTEAGKLHEVWAIV